MDRYIKGLLTAYNRILNLIDAIDPNHLDNSLECIRARIEASVNAYKLFSSKEAIDDYESEYEAKIKALEGTLTMDDLDNFLDRLRVVKHECKILDVPDWYFQCNSNQ